MSLLLRDVAVGDSNLAVGAWSNTWIDARVAAARLLDAEMVNLNLKNIRPVLWKALAGQEVLEELRGLFSVPVNPELHWLRDQGLQILHGVGRSGMLEQGISIYARARPKI